MTDTAPSPAAEIAAFSPTYAPRHSDKQDKLLPELFALQAELDPIHKTEKNEHLRTTYADLNAVWQAIRAPLQAHGLLVLQEPSVDRRGALVHTTIYHVESGQWRLSTIYVPARKPDAQAFGSALSYGRRYGLLTVLGLLTTDDDGHAATAPPSSGRYVQAPAPQASDEVQSAAPQDLDEEATKGWRMWGERQKLQMQGCEDEAALVKCWTGMQPELKKAPVEIRSMLTEVKEAEKQRWTEVKESGIDVDKDVPF